MNLSRFNESVSAQVSAVITPYGHGSVDWT